MNQTSPNQLINIQTPNTTLAFIVTPQQELLHAYYGEQLTHPEDLIKRNSLDKKRMKTTPAFSTFGGLYTDEPALQITHNNGDMTTELRYQSHQQITLDDNCIETRIKLKDEHFPLFVTLIYCAYQAEDMITSQTLIQNNEQGTITLERFASLDLTTEASSYWLSHFHGAWATEMQLKEEELGVGRRLIESKKGVRTTLNANPSFMIALDHPAEEEEGAIIGGALAWSGNYQLSFEVNNHNQLHLIAGIHPFASAYQLETDSSFTTPTFIFTYSSAGKGVISRRFHRWSRQYALRDGTQPRPIVLNSWEGAYFNFDEKILTKMISHAASLGVEMFVLDDGWFGNKYPRNDDKAGLGDWQVNKEKLPQGLNYLIDHAQKEGIQFGIWVEPEMVNPKSELAENHPDWIVQRPHRETLPMRHQLLLDLSNPDVQNFIVQTIDQLLTEHPRIAYIKWDANRHVQNFGSPHLPSHQQSHWWIDYTKGLYKVYERLTKKHPAVIFQACSSGGGRVDFGSLPYHHEFWTSDNTDALSRIFIQWGTSHFYPAIAMGAHVSHSPNHQTGNHTSLSMRFSVAMAGRLGIELQPSDLSLEEIEYTKQAVNTYKRIRPIIQQGDLYRLASPYTHDYAALLYINRTKTEAIVFMYLIKFQTFEAYPTLRLRGLDPLRTYYITELISSGSDPRANVSEQSFTGDYLMKVGIQYKINKTNESVILNLTASTP